MHRLALILPIAGLLGVISANAQIPPGYEIVTVTANEYLEFFPRINNRGQIVFTAWLDWPNRATQEIFLYDNGRLIRITDDNIQDAVPDINDDGTIVWSRGIGPINPSTGEPTVEIVMWENGQLTRLTDNSVQDIGPAINNLGHVVWDIDHPVRACGGYLKDIFMYDGTQVVQITHDALTHFVENQSPEINDLDQIVWTRYDFCNPPPPHNFASKIMMYSGGKTTELTSGQLVPQGPDINNVGQVAWNFRDPATGEDIIELWESGFTTTVAEDAINPAINDRGEIAFQRSDNVTRVWNAWLYRFGRSYQLTDDARDDNVPDINNRGEVTWSSGRFPVGDIRVLSRFVSNMAEPVPLAIPCCP